MTPFSLGQFQPASNPLAVQQQAQASGLLPAQAAAPQIDGGLLNEGLSAAQPQATGAPASPPASPGMGGTPSGGASPDMLGHYLNMLQKLHFGGAPQTTASPGILTPPTDAASANLGVLG